ncbi:MAG: DNA mismatch repair protein MutS [Bacteroidota bacterium]
MQKPIDFYISQKKYFTNKAKVLNKKLTNTSFLRLLVFVSTAIAIYYFLGNIKFVISILLLGLSVFIFLIVKHNDLRYQQKKANELIKINQKEINILNGDYENYDSGDEFTDANHFFSFDIDLFGKGSFFQYLNRTTTKSGTQELAKILTENSIGGIEKKQKALEGLSKKPKWRQDYSATAKMISVDTDSKSILQWIKDYNYFVADHFSFIPLIFSFISFILIIISFLKITPFSVLFLWFLIGISIIFFYIKKINDLYNNADKVKSNFNQYHKLLDLIEKEEFTAPLLQEKQKKIQTEKEKASLILKKFSKILDAFDQRNNMIFGILGNGFLLWDLQQSFKIEKWIKNYHDQVENWFDVIAFFDVQNSLANYHFNHPNHTFPVINKNDMVIDSKNLGHPLIKKNQRIDNDFIIQKKEFFIITGANMAGKSTFLRTVSLSIVMANIGLPVCAEKYEYTPIKLITSMRTSDSLSKDESYFFSELKRLKFIVEEIKTDQYFIVLDEILKGTNSTDKAIGSKRFVEKLVNSGSTGIIATHDLSLCQIEKDYTQIKNKYFDAEILNNELHFDYKLKKGICQNMNASFLLKKMEIV